jgi:ribosomal protein S18 acetylase RimI-like enzyme
MADPDDRLGDGADDTSPITIEPVDAAAIDALVDLWIDLAAGQRAHGSHILPEPNRESVRDTLARHAVVDEVRAARHDGTPVGFVSFALERGAYESDETRGIVHNIYVVPEYRDRGIGSDLLAAAESALADAGASVVALEAMAANDEARRFYRARGYAPHRVELETRVDGGAPASGENDTHSKEG